MISLRPTFLLHSQIEVFFTLLLLPSSWSSPILKKQQKQTNVLDHVPVLLLFVLFCYLYPEPQALEQGLIVCTYFSVKVTTVRNVARKRVKGQGSGQGLSRNESDSRAGRNITTSSTPGLLGLNSCLKVKAFSVSHAKFLHECVREGTD